MNNKYTTNKLFTIPLLCLDDDISLVKVVKGVEEGGHAPGLYRVGVSAERPSSVGQLRET